MVAFSTPVLLEKQRPTWAPSPIHWSNIDLQGDNPLMTPFPELAGDDLRFVADTHFRSRADAGEADRRRRFIGFLDSLPPTATLFLLGDIFDFYFEYRSVVSSRYFDVYTALARCRDRGIPMYFIGGNHDFWVGAFLERELGIRVCPDEITFSGQGRRVVCAHGDLLMPRDWGYKALKTIIRNRAVVGLARWIHPDLLDAIAGAVSHGSRRLPRRTQEARARAVAEHAHKHLFWRGNDILIMGHVHIPFTDARDGRELVIVGDWMDHSPYARLHDGRLTTETFRG